MGKVIKLAAALIIVGLVGASLYLWTPAPNLFDRNAALKAALDYDARIIRDRFGVPHIYGARDADVAFGLAYAHAQDDWATIEEVIFFSRGELAQHKGKSAAIPDYLIGALHVSRDVREKYERDLSPDTRALVEAYAAGANLWCAEERNRCTPGTAPITPYDVVAGFVSRTPFFYGLDEQLTKIFDGDVETVKAAQEARQAFLKISSTDEIGSNAMAVAPSHSADGHTRLMVNSHQPYIGPVAWYEARVKSDEGWDMIGSLFPGAPVILHGAGPKLGWAFTVNKPDLVDVYQLTVENAKKPTKYKFDGVWRNFDVETVTFRVKLFGPFSLPVKRRALYSVHGPVFVTDNGVYGVSYAGAGDIRSAEQWYRMNRARNFADWRTAMEMGAIPSFNVVYADGKGNIGYFYNAAIPIREPGIDWSKAQPGDTSATLWRGQHPFGDVPMIVNPASGYVVNANHPPFKASGEADNPSPLDFPPHMGIDKRETNRGLRIQTLYGGDASITADEFVAYKMDHRYAPQSRVMMLVQSLINNQEAQSDSALSDALETLSKWDGSVRADNRSAALAVLTAQKARGALLNDENAENPDYLSALREIDKALRAGFGRVDPQWSDVVRLKRGDVSLRINGGPDTLRAVYPSGDPAEGMLKAAGGDTYILYADWAPGKKAQIQTIHQFGSATLDETSPHYGDQAPIFAHEEWKTPPMDLDALLAEATSDYRPGKKNAP
jgi:acyl-homoserine-lactone acylase